MNTAIAVQEKPILFPGAMVRKILEDLKTNTRRVFKDMAANVRIVDGTPKGFLPGIPEGWLIPCPYGKPGDRLWVRETWIPVAFGSYEPICGEARRDVCQIEYAAAAHSGYHTAWDHYSGKWRPSIHMPRWASRITLEITEVKVERVQDISEEDVQHEGVSEDMFRDILRPANRFNVVPEHWIHGDDESRSFCHACCRKEIARLKKVDPKRELILDGGWDTEGDGQAFCETCGRALSNTFTDYCAEQELEHFAENGFDVSSPDDCYSAQRIIGSQLWDGGELSTRIKRLAFQGLWDTINAKREGGKYAWAANPWVWAIEFRRLKT